MTSLVKSLTQSLQASSLSDLVRAKQDQNIMLLLDCSGSMGCGMDNGRSRMDGLRETVDLLQGERRMRMAQFGYGYSPSFIERIPEPDGSTPLAEGIDLMRTAGAGRVIVISDGHPDDRHRALESARRFVGRIDVVFVGDPGDPGEAFLRELASLTGGDSFTGDLGDPKLLSSRIMGMLAPPSEDDDDDED